MEEEAHDLGLNDSRAKLSDNALSHGALNPWAGPEPCGPAPQLSTLRSLLRSLRPDSGPRRSPAGPLVATAGRVCLVCLVAPPPRQQGPPRLGHPAHGSRAQSRPHTPLPASGGPAWRSARRGRPGTSVGEAGRRTHA